MKTTADMIAGPITDRATATAKNDLAGVRLERCRFGEEKPTCANCPVHCYQRDRREQARVIMRHAGPRMIWEHPLMSLRHWLDGYRKAPQI